MSNNKSPYGFQFVRNRVAASSNYQTSVYQIAYNNSHSFGKGDVMKLLNTGYVDACTTADEAVMLGILDRVEYYDTSLASKRFANAWLAPSSALAGSCLAYVIEDPNCVFGVQSGNGGPVTIASVGLNANMGGAGAPSTLTGISTAYLDYTTIATTNTLMFRITSVPQNLGNVPTQTAPINNDSTAEYNYVEVTMNTPLALNTTGI